jgi:hypothetical protein
LLAGLIAPAGSLLAGEVPDYRKLQLSDVFFAEGSTFADLNNDGHSDVIAGPWWYAGPAFDQRHPLYPATPFDPLKYSDNFFAFPHDFNRDGWADVLVFGFPGQTATWYENPGSAGHHAPWMAHVVFDGLDNESPGFGDLFGTGQPVIICNHEKTFGYATFDPDQPAAPWTYHPITPPGDWGTYTHGLGGGDINGDGRNDILERAGWWEQPADLAGDPVWRHHPFAFADAGAQMYATDVNGDGYNDVITSIHAHGYGLSWFEQDRNSAGEITFREHVITARDGSVAPGGVQFSQLHALALADVDGDSLPDIVTGKRWWAHGPEGDIEPNAAPVIYAFLLRRGPDHTATFVPHLIDDGSGVGTQLVVMDANADGRPDIVTSNKRGTHVFLSPPKGSAR